MTRSWAAVLLIPLAVVVVLALRAADLDGPPDPWLPVLGAALIVLSALPAVHVLLNH